VHTDLILDQIVSLLAKSDLFPSLAPDHIRALAVDCSWFSVPGGHPVFQEGSESDAIFIVATGLLGVYRRDLDGKDRFLGRIGAGEVVGEMGLLTGEVRTATVKALRDSELLRISKDELQHIAFQSPAVLMELCGTVVRRLQNVQARTPVPPKPATFTLVPHSEDVDVELLARQITTASDNDRDALIVSRELAKGRTADWLSQCERDYRTVVYLAEASCNAWTRSCLRQADAILLVARGAASAAPFSALGPDDAALPKDIPTDLVLLWDGRIAPLKTAEWLGLVRPRAHHHIRTLADAARAARLITGRSLGLVLSGGGARGLAHLGVIRALSEDGIAIDAIGGTSIGAIVGAMLAQEWDVAAAVRAYIDGFMGRPRLSDFTVSRRSLFSGRKTKRLLDELFGETAVEETPIRFYCVSTNLNSGMQSVHSRGRLATWVRASIALPGVFPPVLENGIVYVDGGVLNNLPADTMRGLGLTSVIAVDLGPEAAHSERADMPGLLELLWRVGSIGGEASLRSARKLSDIVITPNVQNIRLLDWRAYDQAMDAGYRAAIERLPDIRQLLKAQRVAY